MCCRKNAPTTTNASCTRNCLLCNCFYVRRVRPRETHNMTVKHECACTLLNNNKKTSERAACKETLGAKKHFTKHPSCTQEALNWAMGHRPCPMTHAKILMRQLQPGHLLTFARLGGCERSKLTTFPQRKSPKA